ncbi:S8 family peptidase [Photobacterium kasasachensis]|uniref:S8 family peptidase n=1 Tax=Photobacterium kasasachensis TaxID=2910240 RepID=UPI003D0B7C8D
MSPRTLKREHNGFSHDCCTPKYLVNQEVTNEKQLQKMTDQERERINWAGRILGLPDVWRLTQGEGVKVAILDTGIDTDHPDLKEAIIASKDFSGDGIEDVDGHGTHCAGIVGARLNGVGFVGVAPKSQLMIGKVLSNNGNGPYSWLIEGIYWAVDNGAQIISMSLGGPSSDSELYKAIQYALYHGVFVICAAGNEGGLFTNSIGYPGKYGGVITVASHDSDGNPSGFTSRGGEVDVMGPGSDIWSTFRNGGYATLSGTSMATPFVAGLAALIASKHESSNSNNTPLLNNEDMRNHLLRMATHPGYHDNQAGYGPLQPFSYF